MLETPSARCQATLATFAVTSAGFFFFFSVRQRDARGIGDSANQDGAKKFRN